MHRPAATAPTTDDIERDVTGDRREAVGGDELVDGGAVADQGLERQLAVPAERVGQRDQHDDGGQRREAATARRPALMRRAGLDATIVAGRLTSRALARADGTANRTRLVARHVVYTSLPARRSHLTDF